ncbi:DEAD/DEAH box helicase [Maritimibacter sp. DP1N21-5]|uniref:DEAD/DEAH box helicase n=1 Tax=Maritimibacter sp. DP1N21-5 TaxID=2836867 RepID=UPI001C45ECF3|nr:DEAD/DEAH box helicase [Maritimibacter sp. DP1N21-5]MBV7409557.1 DEAD/DEAH box helicase [Maritimibacter sp. DP1N21-5]
MIHPSLSQALAERGYETLTPVQEAVSAPEYATRDLLVSAQTGSGKTVGFGIAIAPTLLGENETFGTATTPLALVVAPTRELAFQVMRELRWLYGKTEAWIHSCVGGMDFRDEKRTLERGAHIVVGTPGRLVDHLNRGTLDLSQVRAVVLDEADEMLDLGFREDLETILAAAPEERRTLLFSATVPAAIAKLAETFQRDAERVSTINKAEQHADITYQAVQVGPADGENAIFNLLRFHDAQNAIVFANTRAQVAHLAARLHNRGVPVVALSGELTQKERSNALQSMRDGRARVCVATDVAARGIDLPKLDLVIHADIPTNTEGLLHRSGRTGRAGRKGISALIVPPRNHKKAHRLLGWAKVQAEWIHAPTADEVRAKDEEKLLTDPLWSEEASETEAALAARLTEAFEPQALALAVARMFHAGRAAPEDIGPAPDPRERPERSERKPKEERAPFGPSRWISLSKGANDRAEARWILPVLLNSGAFEKSDIGAIRVQEDCTYVEVTASSLDGFVEALGDGMALEDDLRVKVLDTAPEIKPLPHRDGPPPRKGRDRDDRGPREFKPREDRGERKPRDSYKPREDRAPRDADGDAGDKPRKPRHTKAERPERDHAVHGDFKPRKPREEGGYKKDFGGKPKSEGYKGKSEGYKGKSEGGYRGKSEGGYTGKSDKPFGKLGGKPAGKPGGKPFAKSEDRPARPAKPKPDARDTSKRFERPDGKPSTRKPAGKPGPKSGPGKTGPRGPNARPTRKP